MMDDNRITRNQFNILLVTGVITLLLVLLLGITIGKNMNLPKRFPRADDIARQDYRDGDSSGEAMAEIASLPSKKEQTSKKPHVENEDFLYNDLLNEDSTGDDSDTKTIIKPYTSMSTPADVGSTVSTSQIGSGTSQKQNSESQVPTPDPFVTAKPGFTVAYSVQMSSLSDKNSADKSVRKFQESGYPAYVSRMQYKTGRTLYRVRIGPYETREAADEMMKKLKENTKTSPLVMMLKNGEL